MVYTGLIKRNKSKKNKQKGLGVYMKILHLADLHIGKVVNRFSLLEDQKYILEKVLEITDREKPDTVIIAGDVYDRSIPS